jgi:hypothetical protein
MHTAVIYITCTALGQKHCPKTTSLDLPWEVKLMMATNAELHSFICLFQFMSI